MDGYVPVLGDALLGVAWKVGVVACLLAGGAAVCAGQSLHESGGKPTSGAEAPPHSAFPMPGLKPRPTIQERNARVPGFEVEPARALAARRFLARRGAGVRPGSTDGVGSIPHLKSEMWGTPGLGEIHAPTLDAMKLRQGWGTRSFLIGEGEQKQVLHFVQDDKLSGDDGVENTLPLASGAAVWTVVGPVGVNSVSYGLVTGRVSAIALDPSDVTGNTVFVGTTGGGLWKSQNAAAASGVVFLPVTDGLGALSGIQGAGVSVGAVTVQPGGTGVVLAGLGDPNDALDSYYGAGILRSTDGGKTWALIQQTTDLESSLGEQDYSFLGEGFAGFAWSTTNIQLVVAAVSQAYESAVVGAGVSGSSYEGLYYSADSGATWHLARITDLNGQDVQGPLDPFAYPDGNAATSVVWNPVRRVFVAVVRYHGYYQSTDGMNWTQMAFYPNGQPGVGFTAGNCPTEAGSVGVAGCPIFRGSLAVNPSTGDTFAWTVDAFNQDQGIWQDKCGLSGNACSNQTLSFGTQLNSAALETPGNGGDATILNGDYNLTLAAVPGGLGTGQDTLLFAGDNDLWKCSLANSCAWRNTTNSTTCMSAKVGEYEHGFGWDAGNPLLVFMGTDSGLWRSADQVGETGAVCASTDAAHFQNLNGALGSLAEVESLAQSSTTAATMLAGLGATGFAGVVNAPATAGDWNEVLGGEGGTVAVSPSGTQNNWYANNAAGVSIFHCTAAAGTACTPAGFGSTAVIDETQVANDGLGMPFPAEFEFDALDPTQLLIGTCRVWRGPATGAGWPGGNAISPVLDGTGAGTDCAGNSLIRSIATATIAGGGEAIYVGMAGEADGGGVAAGHVFTATLNAAGTVGSWTDLGYSPVVNSGLGFNAFGEDVSGLYVDPHDTTGGTVYATVAGFDTPTQTVEQVYRSTDGGQHWTAIGANLPDAPANAVVVDAQDPNTVYVAMDTGVYVTRAISTCATAACWSAYGTGLPLAPVTQLIGTPPGAASLVLTAGTYGRGVWQIPLATAGVTLTAATASPTTLTFPSTTVGVTSSSAQTVTLRNTGTAVLTVTSVGMTGVAAGDFGETDTCVGVPVARGAACTLRVTFTPTEAGNRVGALAINANVADGQVLVALNGTGLATANVTLQPPSLSFGTVQVGTTSAGQTINVQNVGGSTVSITSITVTAPFLKAASTCGSSLAAGTGCAVTVTFAPTTAGAAAGSLTVKDSIGSQAAVLNGTGVAGPSDTLSSTTLSFPSTVQGQISAPMTVTISNTGGEPLTGIGTSVASSTAGDFTAVSGCGSTLAAGSSCGVSVTFAPSTTKAETGTLTISDALKAQAVTLKGTGLRPAALTLSKTAFTFGSVEVNVAGTPQTLTITNSGGAPMAQPVFSITGSGAANFSTGATTCGATLAAAATCTVAVTFTPVVAGAVTATLTVGTSTVDVAAVTASLGGTGLTPPMMGVSPAQVNLGTVLVGNSSGLFTVRVTNTGQIALAGPTFAVSGLSAGAQAADFALSAPTDVPACTGTLNPGATCSIQVTFSPSLVGTETATLTATGSNAVPGTSTVALTGVGSPTIVLQASATQVSFAATAVGTTSAAQTLTISNLGKQTANGLTFSLTGPYGLSATPTTCPTTGKGTLAGKSSCVVGLAFTPTAGGNQPGLLTVSVSNLGVASLVVPLDGTGLGVGGLTLNPTQMTFGSAVVKTSSTAQTLTVTNSGQAGLTGVQIQIAGDYSLTGNSCAGTLATGASCMTEVVFTPSTTGVRTGTMTVSTTSTGVAPGVVPLTGNGIPGGALTANPAVVSFGSVTVGQTSPAQTVTLTNAGATTLGGLTFAVAGDYSLPQNGCGTQLANGGTCSFTVSFSPGLTGTRIGAITVGSSNAGFTSVLVGLTGNGLAAAQLMVTPPQLAFGPVTVGSNSAAMQLTVTNPGTGPLTGLLFQSVAPFSVGSGSCGALLPAGGTCGVPVVFAPAVGGSQSGAVMVSSTSLGVPTVTVGVSGTGVAPASLSLNPAALTFAGTAVGTTSAGQTVTVSNPGGVALAGLVITISGTAAGDFAVGSSSCTGTLAGGGSCTAVVSFAPTVTGGRTGFVTASSTTKGVMPAAASLSGTGLTPAVLGMAPAQLTFGATPIGTTSATQTVTVTNSGQSSIADMQMGVTAGFELDATQTTCTAVLAGGASCVAGVAFTPMTNGAITGAVTAKSATGNAAATAALTGTGALPPGIATVPAALVQFGTTGVGIAGQPVAVTLTNTGTVSAVTGLTVGVDANGTANGFGISTNTCGTAVANGTLQAGASCTVQVTFKPALAGALTGTLQIKSTNGGGQTGLALAGIGLDFHFTIVGSSTGTVVQGQTANYKMAVTPLGGTSGGVTFACGKLPTNALCIFNPAQLGGLKATGNVQLGIGTGAPQVAAIQRGPAWGERVLVICAVLILPLGWWRRRYAGSRMSRLLVVGGLLIAVVSGVSSCASAGGSGGELHSIGGTPTGSYTVTVTATSAGVAHSLPVTLVVN